MNQPAHSSVPEVFNLDAGLLMRLRLLTVFLLLMDAVIFVVRGEYNDGFDSLAWITLMALYELESSTFAGRINGRDWLRPCRNLAIGVVVIAETSYLFEGAWLDVLYSIQWLLVIALFEFETRQPELARAHLPVIKGFGILLGLSMAVVVAAWFYQGLWFNAFDALIWTMAFILIDLDLVKHPNA